MSRQQNRYQSPFGRTKPQENGGQGQQGGLSHQQFLSGAGVQAALGGLSYGVNGRPLNGPTSIPYLQPSIFASPKAAAGGRMNSEPPTPTSGASGASSGLAAGRPTAQTPTGRGALGSPKLGSGYNPVTGAPTTTPTRRGSGSLGATAPPGSLAGIQRIVDAAGGGGLGSTMGRGSGSGNGIFGSTTRTGSGILGSTLSGNANLSATMPAATTGSRPPTGGQSALLSTAPAGGSRPGTGLAGQLARANLAAVPGLSFSVGSNQSMGARGYQEDYRSIADPTSTPGMANLPNVLLGAAVYDGHGGKQVSHWLASSYCLLNRCMEAVQHLVATGGSPNDVAGVLDDVFSACGSAAISGRMTAGSCVALMLLVQAAGVPWVLSANVGDSRTVLVSWDDPAEGGGGGMMGMTMGGGGGGGRPEGLALSVDHKLGPAKTSEETRRVQAAGGTVIQLFGTWRIDGSLAVARAIGDSDFQRYVSYHPTVSCRQLARRDRWLIIASDGLWDVMSNEEVALFCRAQHQLSAAKLAEALVREAVRNRGSGDNTTVVAVRLQYNPPPQAAS
ncbi:hypothetical protein HYH02_013543 [Chlamydomonas schloesseri]|uniref:PPM-type phosphatase domain-containing protein n=1 Tax=Chlamydomonas schloesseri TaxID=2026947 RepID=A0A835SZD4_9CHLO|nr:hypothetical protein HYH02_013543 [Chlamydomonas schloesseri]|eukprot:KAG2431014.1 hypothetical protein HYH02_013543 [Chlamydomonas schloesseri]